MTNLIVFGLIHIVFLTLCGYFMSRMPGRTFSGSLPELTASELLLKDHLRTHVETLALVSVFACPDDVLYESSRYSL